MTHYLLVCFIYLFLRLYFIFYIALTPLFLCHVYFRCLYLYTHVEILSNTSCLNHAVRRANVPEMLNEDYISDVEEGIFFCSFSVFYCFSLAFFRVSFSLFTLN